MRKLVVFVMLMTCVISAQAQWKVTPEAGMNVTKYKGDVAKEAILILDDHVELAKKLEVDGVHLGKKDMPIGEARQMLGEAFIIGGTANTFEDVKLHHAAGADYLGIGPFRFTTTKKNLSPVLGLEGYTSILAQMNEAGIRIPVVAIGGIVAEDIPAIMETGVNGIALSGAILQAPDPVEETKRILNI